MWCYTRSHSDLSDLSPVPFHELTIVILKIVHHFIEGFMEDGQSWLTVYSKDIIVSNQIVFPNCL